MNLTLTLALAHAILRFSTPGPGRYVVFSESTYTRIVCASNHETNAVHVTVPVKMTRTNETFWVWFKPDP